MRESGRQRPYGGIEESYSPFAAQVLAQPCVGNFKLPSIPPYDGRTDPHYHVQHYETWMTMQGQTDATLCQAFSLTLTGSGFEWFQSLRPGSIPSFRALREAFLARFATLVAQNKSKTYHLSIRQGRDEILRQYLARFTEESHKVEVFDDKDAIAAITEGARTSDFLKSIVGQVPRDMAELMMRARTHMGIEDYLDGRDGRKSGGQSSRHREEQDEDRPDPRRKRSRGGRAPNGRPLSDLRSSHVDNFRALSTYTPLNTPQERILALHRDKLGSPAPLAKDPAKRDRNKFCEYHQDHGHLTSECYHLRRQIEALIQDGKLKEYVLRTVGAAAVHEGRPRQGRKGPATVTVMDQAAIEEPESSQLHVVG